MNAMSEPKGNPVAANDGLPRPAFAPGRRTMTIMDAIYSRRAVRRFTATPVPETAIHALLYAAVQAPTLAQDSAALGFSIIGDRQILCDLSEWTGRLYNAIEGQAMIPHIPHHGAEMNDLDFFHGSSLLIVIYDLSGEARHIPECWMAAENLMLAACGMGLGTCLIAPAVDALNGAEWKRRLTVPKAALAVAAIVLGTPEGPLPTVNRYPPEVFSWLS